MPRTPPKGGSSPSGAAAPPERPPTRPRERMYRRALAAGLVVSGLVHLFLFLVVGRLHVDRASFSRPPPPERPPEEGLVVIHMQVVAEPDAEEAPPETAPEAPPARRPEELEVVRPVPVPEREVGPPREEGIPVEGVEEEGLANAERLRPRVGDERLWIDFNDPLRPMPDTERYARALDELRRIVRAWLDSLELTEDQRRRAMDWTVGEGDRRWGVSAEGLHLGDVTIPIPFGTLFQLEGPRGREVRQALRDLAEIRQQDIRLDTEEAIRERREEMRRRSREEAERRRERDTTSVRSRDGPPP